MDFFLLYYFDIILVDFEVIELYVYVGKFLGTHGLKGEIKLKSNFEYIDRILKKGFNFYIGDNKNKEIFSNYRIHKGNYLVVFKGLEDINLIEKYINKKVYVL